MGEGRGCAGAAVPCPERDGHGDVPKVGGWLGTRRGRRHPGGTFGAAAGNQGTQRPCPWCRALVARGRAAPASLRSPCTAQIPIPTEVTPLFSPQHERARGLRARRRHRLHQHQLAEVGVGGSSRCPPLCPLQDSALPRAPTDRRDADSLPKPQPCLITAFPSTRPRYFTYFSDPTVPPPPQLNAVKHAAFT